MKIQKAVRDETLHIALGVILLSLVMQGVFFLIGKWDMAVLWGNLLGGGYAILNFFILGLTVQKVAGDADEKRGKNLMQFSYSSRMFLTVVIVFLGLTLSAFNWVAVLLPQFFPRLTIAAMGFTGKHAKQAVREQQEAAARAAAAEPAAMDNDAADDADLTAALAEAEALEAEAKAAEARAKAAKARAAAARAAAHKAKDAEE